MAKRVITASVFFFVAAAGFSQSTDSISYLKGSWHIAPGSIDVAAQYSLERFIKKNPALSGIVTITMVASRLHDTSVEFRKDGTMEITSPDGTDKGTWKLLDSNKRLEYTTPRLGLIVREILRISKDKLVMKFESGPVVEYLPK